MAPTRAAASPTFCRSRRASNTTLASIDSPSTGRKKNGSTTATGFPAPIAMPTSTNNNATLYRVTARGWGRTTNTVVTLQTVFRLPDN